MKPVRCRLGWHDYEETGRVDYHTPLTIRPNGVAVWDYRHNLPALAVSLRCSRCGKTTIKEPINDWP